MIKKRFIAGAICPACKQMDKLVMYRENDTQVRECVECGFSENQSAILVPDELETRVNTLESVQEVEPVKFIQPK